MWRQNRTGMHISEHLQSQKYLSILNTFKKYFTQHCIWEHASCSPQQLSTTLNWVLFKDMRLCAFDTWTCRPIQTFPKYTASGIIVVMIWNCAYDTTFRLFPGASRFCMLRTLMFDDIWSDHVSVTSKYSYCSDLTTAWHVTDKSEDMNLKLLIGLVEILGIV